MRDAFVAARLKGHAPGRGMARATKIQERQGFSLEKVGAVEFASLIAESGL